MFSQLGFSEILIILLILLLVFGARRLPEMGAAMGKGIREFKKNIKDVQQSIDTPADEASTGRRLDAPAREAQSEGEPKKLSQ
ncbi:MAG: twin-arginine translocase TatA/TatE family subunit [Gemmatimonadales bacterium]|jgi:sec-independent protein translocase protein TatA